MEKWTIQQSELTAFSCCFLKTRQCAVNLGFGHKKKKSMYKEQNLLHAQEHLVTSFRWRDMA